MKQDNNNPLAQKVSAKNISAYFVERRADVNAYTTQLNATNRNQLFTRKVRLPEGQLFTALGSTFATTDPQVIKRNIEPITGAPILTHTLDTSYAAITKEGGIVLSIADGSGGHSDPKEDVAIAEMAHALNEWSAEILKNYSNADALAKDLKTVDGKIPVIEKVREQVKTNFDVTTYNYYHPQATLASVRCFPQADGSIRALGFNVGDCTIVAWNVEEKKFFTLSPSRMIGTAAALLPDSFRTKDAHVFDITLPMKTIILGFTDFVTEHFPCSTITDSQTGVVEKTLIPSSMAALLSPLPQDVSVAKVSQTILREIFSNAQNQLDEEKKRSIAARKKYTALRKRIEILEENNNDLQAEYLKASQDIKIQFGDDVGFVAASTTSAKYPHLFDFKDFFNSVVEYDAANRSSTIPLKILDNIEQQIHTWLKKPPIDARYATKILKTITAAARALPDHENLTPFQLKLRHLSLEMIGDAYFQDASEAYITALNSNKDKKPILFSEMPGFKEAIIAYKNAATMTAHEKLISRCLIKQFNDAIQLGDFEQARKSYAVLKQIFSQLEPLFKELSQLKEDELEKDRRQKIKINLENIMVAMTERNSRLDKLEIALEDAKEIKKQFELALQEQSKNEQLKVLKTAIQNKGNPICNYYYRHILIIQKLDLNERDARKLQAEIDGLEKKMSNETSYVDEVKPLQQYVLGLTKYKLTYQKNENTEPSISLINEAKQHFTKAVEGGCYFAYKNLGDIAKNEKNNVLAEYYYKRAELNESNEIQNENDKKCEVEKAPTVSEMIIDSDNNNNNNNDISLENLTEQMAIWDQAKTAKDMFYEAIRRGNFAQIKTSYTEFQQHFTALCQKDPELKEAKLVENMAHKFASLIILETAIEEAKKIKERINLAASDQKTEECKPLANQLICHPNYDAVTSLRDLVLGIRDMFDQTPDFNYARRHLEDATAGGCYLAYVYLGDIAKQNGYQGDAIRNYRSAVEAGDLDAYTLTRYLENCVNPAIETFLKKDINTLREKDIENFKVLCTSTLAYLERGLNSSESEINKNFLQKEISRIEALQQESKNHVKNAESTDISNATNNNNNNSSMSSKDGIEIEMEHFLQAERHCKQRMQEITTNGLGFLAASIGLFYGRKITIETNKTITVSEQEAEEWELMQEAERSGNWMEHDIIYGK